MPTHRELRVPVATYRLQFHSEFRFVDAQQILAYLDVLGITDIFASPILQARKASRHGYDVTDHSKINPELGSEEDFLAFSDALLERSMGLMVDVVPNHMGIDDPACAWWLNVLENGPSSPYAKYFDIDWSPPKRDLHNRVLLPFLGDQYGKVLENGEIQLKYDSGAFYVSYYDRTFPTDPRSTRVVLEMALEHVRFVAEADDPELIELESIVTALGYLPKRTETSPEKIEERQREKEVAKRRLADLAQKSGPVQRAIEAAVEELNGQRGDPRSFDRLESLLAEQTFRLCYWRVAADEINYRRFFDINELAAIRVEEPEVFDAVHDVVLRLIGAGRVTALRIDHPDGLFDPEHYFLLLQAKCREALQGGEFALPPMPLKGLDCACYVAVEKILCHNERLPERWAVHGTTGYEMLNLINGLFVHPEARTPLFEFYRQVSGPAHFHDVVYACKKLILNVSMSSELHVLARRLDRISEQHRWSRDFTFWSLYEALGEVVACFPVYRTYTRMDAAAVGEEDQKYVEQAIRTAKRRNTATDPSIFDFLRDLLLLDDPDDISQQEAAARRDFVMRLQQLTGPVMAKGVEDTAFYRIYPLASLNEVGGEPQRFEISPEQFHRTNQERVEQWPFGMTATSTHDAKRSEDVRARLNVLSEIPDEWIDAVGRWRALNADKKTVVEEDEAPDSNEEYLLYQTLLGAWPLVSLDDAEYHAFVGRIAGYMEKALKEAKIHTSWVNPDKARDRAVSDFVRMVLDRSSENPFLEDFQRFLAQVEFPAMCNSLSQLLLKIGMPGVCDLYQGCDMWSFSLVDPDNRRVVDYSLRRRQLESIQQRERESRKDLCRHLLEHWRDGTIKLYVTYRGLNYRREHQKVILHGDYLPCQVRGKRAENIIAFLRKFEDRYAAVVVPRYVSQIAAAGKPLLGEEAWGETTLILPREIPSTWENVFTGEFLDSRRERGARTMLLHGIFQTFPVALLSASTGE